MDGLSNETAIVIGGVPQEHIWIRAHYPGWTAGLQGLEEAGDKSYDMLTLTDRDGGETRDISFDITEVWQQNKAFIEKLRQAREL